MNQQHKRNILKQFTKHAKKSKNQYALGHYCMALSKLQFWIKDGESSRTAALNCFNGKLLDDVLKAMGLEAASDSEHGGDFRKLPAPPESMLEAIEEPTNFCPDTTANKTVMSEDGEKTVQVDAESISRIPGDSIVVTPIELKGGGFRYTLTHAKTGFACCGEVIDADIDRLKTVARKFWRSLDDSQRLVWLNADNPNDLTAATPRESAKLLRLPKSIAC